MVCKLPPPPQCGFWDLPVLGENNEDSNSFGELQGQLETAIRKSNQLSGFQRDGPRAVADWKEGCSPGVEVPKFCFEGHRATGKP